VDGVPICGAVVGHRDAIPGESGIVVVVICRDCPLSSGSGRLPAGAGAS
jgi:hypothetical protein